MKIGPIIRKIKSWIAKQLVYISIALALIILAGGYFLFISKTVSEINRIGTADIKVKQQELASRQSSIRKFQALEKQYQALNSDQMERLASMLPSGQDIPYLVIKLKKFVEDNNLILNSIDVGPLGSGSANNTATSGAGVKKLTISLSINGIDSYNSLKSFLDQLSTNQPLLELTSLSYSPEAESYSLNLSSYYK